MADQKNIIIPLDEKSELVLVEITKKHQLEENEQQIVEKVKNHSLFNESIVIKLTRSFMVEEITENDLLTSFQKEFNIDQVSAQSLFEDIKSNLIPLLKKYTEEELKHYREPEKAEEKLIFNLPKNATFDEAVDQILEKNGLQETKQEALKKSQEGKESRATIIKDAATAMAKKLIPKEKLVELLQKHLETNKEIAEKIVTDITTSLIPSAKIIETSKNQYSKEHFQEELLNKVRQNTNIPIESEPELPASYIKKVPVIDVEKNAQAMTHVQQRKEVIHPIEEPKPTEKNTDPYKEPVE